jgi:hypothetical protein
MIIYKTTNLVNGKIYIGKDKLNNPDYFGSGTKIKLALEKYGKDNFKKEIIDTADTIDELDEKEKYWIKELNSQDRSIGYNIRSGGQGGFIIGVYDSWVNKYGEERAIELYKEYNLSKASKGSKNGSFKEISLSDEEVVNLYNSGQSMNNIAKLCNVSKTKIATILDKHGIKKRSINEQCKTRPLPTDETRKKMSESHKGKHKESFYECWVNKYGKEIADKKMEEYKQKMSTALINKNKK